TIDGAALDHFVIEQNGGGAIVAQNSAFPFAIQITAQDVFNNTVTSFNGGTNLVTLTADAGTTNVTLTLGDTTAAFTNGVLTGHLVTLTSNLLNSGTTFLTATHAGSGTSSNSNTFTITNP